MAEVSRPPDEAFAALPDFPFAPRYREVEGLRLAHIDEGDGAPVIFIHGEPTWSFLYRHVIPPVRDAGYRCLAPDLAGFGRSDKPTDPAWYSYQRHVAHVTSFVDELDLRGATLVVHDQGGPIGLRVAVERPERIDRLVILDTDLVTGETRRTDTWFAFRDFVVANEDLPIAPLIQGGCKHDPGKEVIAAYEAPYPDAPSKAGARAFPQLIPLSPDAPAAVENKRVRAALHGAAHPTLMLWADADPIYPLAGGQRFAEALGCPPPRIIEDAAHFLQEDQGPLLGELIADWLTQA